MAYKDLLQPTGVFNTDFTEEDYNKLVKAGFTDEDIYNMSSEDIDTNLNAIDELANDLEPIFDKLVW